MKLTTNESPGRITRKAREFEADIAQLRAQGYTLAAIARSLAAAGVQVSITTVRREVNRRPVPNPSTPPGSKSTAVQPRFTVPAVPAAASATAASPTTAAAALFSPGQPDPPSAKELAEAFARSKNVNPFVRAKEQS